MKASKLAILLGLGASVASLASAKSLEQTYLDSCKKDPGIPVPISVVSPHVAPDAAGQHVEVEFIVTTTGTPTGISIRSSSDATLNDDVVAAVKQWQFLPAKKDGMPVATKVILPVRVTADNRFAAN